MSIPPNADGHCETNKSSQRHACLCAANIVGDFLGKCGDRWLLAVSYYLAILYILKHSPRYCCKKISTYGMHDKSLSCCLHNNCEGYWGSRVLMCEYLLTCKDSIGGCTFARTSPAAFIRFSRSAAFSICIPKWLSGRRCPGDSLRRPYKLSSLREQTIDLLKMSLNSKKVSKNETIV